jgi:hypothetical protein
MRSKAFPVIACHFAVDQATKAQFVGTAALRAAAAPVRLAFPELLLPGALLMTMRAQLLAPLMLINFRFSTFF